MPDFWTNHEIDTLRSMARKSIKATKRHLTGRSECAIAQKRYVLGISAEHKRWTKEENKYIMDHPEISSKQIARDLGRSMESTKTQRWRLKKCARSCTATDTN